MCLAVPMRIIELLDANLALAAVDEVQSKADISLLDDPAVGDYIIVHAGFAIEKLDEDEAKARIELFREISGKKRQ